MMAQRRVRDSQVITTQLVLPNDTNGLGNLLGGTLMHWIDIAAAIAAQRHADRVCVTASVDELNFHYPVRLGDVVTPSTAPSAHRWRSASWSRRSRDQGTTPGAPTTPT